MVKRTSVRRHLSTKHGKPRQRRSEKNNSPYFAKHPFSGLDNNIIHSTLIEIAKAEHAAFPDLLNRILDFFRRCFPLHILATLAAYGLETDVSDEGVASRGLTKEID